MTETISTRPEDEVIIQGTVKFVDNNDGASILKGAKVKAINTELGITLISTTDEHGHYVFDRLRKGKWRFSVSASNYQTVVADETKIEGNQDNQNFLLYPECINSNGTIDLAQGKRFFYQMIALLITLIITYIASHNIIQNSLPHAQQSIQEVVHKAANLIENKQDPERTVKLSQYAKYLASMSEQPLIITFLSTKESQKLTKVAKQLSELIPELQDATKQISDQETEVRTTLTALQKDLQQHKLHHGYIWNEMPWRLLEILFWATAGVLVNKIMTTGYYMRKRTFYREGIIMHYSHLFAVPLMVLVVVLLLSVFSIQFIFQNDASLKLDLNNPVMLISIAFLLASRPWAIRDFLKEKAGNVLGQNATGEKQN